MIYKKNLLTKFSAGALKVVLIALLDRSRDKVVLSATVRTMLRKWFGEIAMLAFREELPGKVPEFSEKYSLCRAQ